MTEYNDLTARYIGAWNEADPAARRAAVNALWTDGGRYVDPLVDAQGHEEIDATIAAAQAQFPGFRFRLAGPVDGHHRQCRFAWELGPSDGAAPIAGFDVAVLAEDGRVESVHGFLDRVPAS